MTDNKRFPALFIGHGSPMNIIQINEFTNDLKDLKNKIPIPRAILVISAHWLTSGTAVTCEPNPRQIYDFYGFPNELYEFKYEAPGDPEIGKYIAKSGYEWNVKCSSDWGLDHASYMVLGHIFPDANIPTLELSLDYKKPATYHYQVAKFLKSLREEGVLIIGSGNLIHTFSYINPDQYAKPFDWAIEYNEYLKKSLLERNHEDLIHYKNNTASQIAFQTNEHYLPMLYIIALQEEEDNLSFFHEGFQHGSISHLSFMIK